MVFVCVRVRARLSLQFILPPSYLGQNDRVICPTFPPPTFPSPTVPPQGLAPTRSRCIWG